MVARVYLILGSDTSQDARWNDDVNVMTVAGQSSQVVFFVSCLLSSPIYLIPYVTMRTGAIGTQGGIGRNAKISK